MKHIFLLLTLFLFACGNSSSDDNVDSLGQKVQNGWVAEHADYPSIVAITHYVQGTSFCTGTLLADDLVLTAAHCVYGKSSAYVVHGVNEPGINAPENTYYESYDLKVHPKYLLEHPQYDIGLILLKNSVKTNNVCSKMLTDKNQLTVGKIVRIAGFGRYNDYEGGKLHAGNVPITELNDSEMTLGLDDPDNDPTAACFGDSGGPAYVNVENKRYVTGVTSRDASSTGECERGAIYSLPLAHLDWITETGENMRESRDGIKTLIDCKDLIPSTKPTKHHVNTGCSLAINNDKTFTFIMLFFLGAFIFRRRKVFHSHS